MTPRQRIRCSLGVGFGGEYSGYCDSRKRWDGVMDGFDGCGEYNGHGDGW